MKPKKEEKFEYDRCDIRDCTNAAFHRLFKAKTEAGGEPTILKFCHYHFDLLFEWLG